MFIKAHILMGIGFGIGEIIAHFRDISCSWLLGLLIGLLFSAHHYKKCLIVLIREYKRLKTKNKHENIS